MKHINIALGSLLFCSTSSLALAQAQEVAPVSPIEPVIEAQAPIDASLAKVEEASAEQSRAIDLTPSVRADAKLSPKSAIIINAKARAQEEVNAMPDADAMTFSIDGQVRLREEIRRGLYSPSDNMGAAKFDLTHLRSRVFIRMDKGDVSGVIELQDNRILGETGTVSNIGGIDLRRGALKVNKLMGSAASFEAGRIVLAYGEQRLIGHLEWVGPARTFDGTRLEIPFANDAKLDVFATVTRETIAEHNDQYFGGAYFTMPTAKGLTSEFYGLSLIDREEQVGERGDLGKSAFVVAGTRQAYKKDGVDASLEVTAQFGERAGDDFFAYGLALRGAYTLEGVQMKPRFGAEFVLGSGDSDPTDDKQSSFQNLFPTNHLFYGYADQVGWTNLTAVRGSVGLAPTKNIKLSADYHHLRLTESAGGWFHVGGAMIRPGDVNASSHLGDEIDLVVKYKWRPGLGLSAGYSLFAPGAFVDDTGGGVTAHFAFLQLAATFK